MINDEKWEYFGKKKNGDVRLIRKTNESLEDVIDYLEQREIIYSNSGSPNMIWIYINGKTYTYWWETGTWGQNNDLSPRKGTKKYYKSLGIEDLFNRFLDKEVEKQAFFYTNSLNTGKYKGLTINEVLEIDPNYLDYLRKKTHNVKLRKDIDELFTLNEVVIVKRDWKEYVKQLNKENK